MELRQLEYFVAVVEEGSFTKAAAKLHVAQPGVSAQVRQLESDFGATLFDRTGRTVHLTAVGAAVLPYARAALTAVAGARLAAEELTGLVRGRVAVGMVVACSSLDLTDTLAGFHREHPGVEITVAEANSDELVRAVLSGELDLAFVGLAGATPSGLELHVVADEALVAAVAVDDPLPVTTAIAIGVLADLPLISLPRGTGLRSCLDQACAAAGIEVRIAFEASAPEMVARFAERGLGVALLPESVARAHAATLRAITITGVRMRSRIGLAWRLGGPTSPAARALISRARETLGPAAGSSRPTTSQQSSCLPHAAAEAAFQGRPPVRQRISGLDCHSGPGRRNVDEEQLRSLKAQPTTAHATRLCQPKQTRPLTSRRSIGRSVGEKIRHRRDDTREKRAREYACTL